jgi:hypothetical protein
MVMNDQELDERLRRLPKEVGPLLDYWPAIRRQIRHRRSHVALRAATVAAIFLAGLALGRVTLPGRHAPMPDTDAGKLAPFFVATEVQRSGTAYLSALAQLRALATSTHDTLAVRQGYEAAVAVMQDASAQLTGSMRDIGPELVRETSRARMIAAEHVMLSLQGKRQ